MNLKSLITKAGIGSAIVASSFLLFNCSNKITEEQLQQLDELRKQEKSLRAEISSVQDEKSSLQREIDARKKELEKCQKDTEIVKQRLSEWPDVWPDWSPEPKEGTEEE